MATFTTSWIGQSLENGRFLVGEKLGEGGMAIVFKAHDRTTNIDVVIKVPKQNALEDKTFLKRFAAENRALMNLRHPHVVSILHVGEFEGWPFAVLQYLPGGDLESCRKEFDGKLSLLNVSKWLPKIADALDFIHANGYVHRDVKPSNVLFDGQGQAFLSDFGVAKVVSDQASKMTHLTGTGMVLGTPDYMAPELIMGRPIDGRVDQYALAMTVYECLAGRLPFRAPTPAAILVMQTTQKLPPLSKLNPDLPQAISQIVMRALAKKPGERFPSCNIFAEKMLKAIEHSGQAVLPTSASQPIPAVTEPVETIHIDTSRPLTKTQTARRTLPRKRRTRTLESVWRNKHLLLAGGAATLIVVLLILMVIVRSWRSPVVSPIAEEASSPLAPSSADPIGTTPEATAISSSPDRPAFAAGTQAGQEWDGNGLGMTFCWCPPGTFTMGSPPTEAGRGTNEDPVTITLTQGFWVGKTEITRDQWQRIMGTTPWKGQSNVREDPNGPAIYVTWHDAMAFCHILTTQERQAGRLPADWKYTLPTEAQWEYACRAGTTTAYSFGDDESQLSNYAWWGGIYGNGNTTKEQYAHAVGRRIPNPWGLHDVHANVWEWCADWYGAAYDNNSTTDPQGPETGTQRVGRGGGWNHEANKARSAYRDKVEPSYRSSRLGFRVICVPSDSLKPTLIGSQAGQQRQDNELRMAFCWCPPGTFQMGSPPDQVSVTLTQGFWLGQCEVTQGQWEQVMGTMPWKGQKYAIEDPHCAASYLNWNEAVAFCKLLTKQERQAGRLPEDWEYALPTEAQWEYACRAGTTTVFSFGENQTEFSEYGWWGGIYGDGNAKTEQYPHRIGQKKPNPWGLCDMHGNVWEWCSDFYQETLPGGTDPEVTSGGTRRVHRGGSWLSHPQYCTSAFRGGYAAVSSSAWGFRIACVPTRPSEPTSNPPEPMDSKASTSQNASLPRRLAYLEQSSPDVR